MSYNARAPHLNAPLAIMRPWATLTFDPFAAGRRADARHNVRDDVMVPAELGREIAAGIPGARFVLLPGKNHILLEGDPGLPKLFDEVQRFLKG